MINSSSHHVRLYPVSHTLATWLFLDFLVDDCIALCFYLPGKQIDGIWHTAIVAYGQEYFFGGDSIECCVPVRTKHQPLKSFS